MSITVTITHWHIIGYLAIGLVLWLPLEYVAYRRTAHPKKGFWPGLRDALRASDKFIPLAVMLLWPLCIYVTLTE